MYTNKLAAAAERMLNDANAFMVLAFDEDSVKIRAYYNAKPEGGAK